jgi:cytochrome c oxidase assembly factor CtaG
MIGWHPSMICARCARVGGSVAGWAGRLGGLGGGGCLLAGATRRRRLGRGEPWPWLRRLCWVAGPVAIAAAAWAGAWWLAQLAAGVLGTGAVAGLVLGLIAGGVAGWAVASRDDLGPR